MFPHFLFQTIWYAKYQINLMAQSEQLLALIGDYK